MSSLAYPPGATSRGSGESSRSLPAVLAGSGTDVLLVVLVLAFGVIVLAGLTGDFSVDSWLELVTGRLVWQNGIPHHETLTLIAQGHVWTDQQWLSQLAAYALDRVGGLGLLGLVNTGLLVAAVGGAMLASRRLGGPARSVLVLMPLCWVAISPWRAVRTQEFAMPLFVLVVWLLVSDCRAPSRRLLWCLPILVLWANLHGSVTLGAAFVVLRALTLAWERRAELRHGVRAWGRPLALALGSALAVMVTPYGLSIVGYYRTTLGAGTLAHYVSEWAPITSSPVVAIAVFAVAALALWSFGRAPDNTTLWEKLALLAVCAMTISVVRNAVFFGLLSLVVVPRSLGWGSAATPADGVDRRRTVVNGLLVLGVTLAVLITVVATLQRPDSQIADTYASPGLLMAVQSATRADPSLRVLAQDEYSDWLLWKDPALAGRVAGDVRFELMTASQIVAFRNLYQAVGTGWMRAARGYRLLVLSEGTDVDSIPAFERQAGSRVLYRNSQAVVILRTAAGARA